MLNWAEVYCGKLGIENTKGESIKGDPILLDAEQVETALLTLKGALGQRRSYYDVLMTRYRNRWMVETSADALRMSIARYRQIMNYAYRWLDGRLGK